MCAHCNPMQVHFIYSFHAVNVLCNIDCMIYTPIQPPAHTTGHQIHIHSVHDLDCVPECKLVWGCAMFVEKPCRGVSVLLQALQLQPPVCRIGTTCSQPWVSKWCVTMLTSGTTSQSSHASGSPYVLVGEYLNWLWADSTDTILDQITRAVNRL